MDMDATVCHTYCDSFSFNYRWTVGNLKAFVDSINRGSIKSSSFYPGFCIEGKKAECVLSLQASCLKYPFVTHTCPNGVTSRSDASKCTCVRLEVCLQCEPSVRLLANGSLSLMALVEDQKLDVPANFCKAKKVSVKSELVNFSKVLNISVVVSQKELELGSSKYTYNDSLSVYCKMTVHMVNELKHTTNSIPLVAPVSVSAALNNDRENQIFTDASIKCGEKQFEVHRVVIASQSPFFKSKIKRWKTSDNTIDMSDLEPQIVQTIIEHMYGQEQIPDLNVLAPDLLAAADKYQLSSLKNLCEKALLNELTDSNAVTLLKLANTYNALHLREKILEFVNARPIKLDMVKTLVDS
ncbi:speckle-type POZ protein-like [Halichondria panicea]|uniref:speckle-type POZ protein-like n=1 Tax=Halichondria panicea TaxID=6063 RepID=UPI00312BA181